MRKIDLIVVHCSASEEGKDFTIKDIRRWHKANGWKREGYHYFVRLDGTIEVGRPLEEAGAHAKGYNSNSIGVCYCGGIDKDKKPKDTRTNEQKKSLVELLKTLKALFPNAKIVSHHDLNKGKACPCFDATEEYKDI
jgi:N-acetylmuramoyl-L-alanine amidase